MIMKFLQHHAGTALAYREKNFTFTDLLQNVNCYSEIIKPFHPQKVMIFSENRPEWIFTFYAAWMQGAVVVPADIMSTAPELKYMIEDCNPELVFALPTKKISLPALSKTSKMHPN